MSDFFSSGWSIFVAAATIVSLIACLVLLFIAARRRAPASGVDDNTTGHIWDEDLRETEQPAAALVDVPVRHHRAVRVCLPGAVPRPGQLRRQPELEQPRPVRSRAGARRARDGAAVRALRVDGRDRAGPRHPGHGHRRAPVHQQLRRLPRLGRTRQQGLPEPDRQRLAVGRRVRDHPADHRPGPQRRHAADGRRGRQRRRRAQRRALRAQPVGQPARQRRRTTRPAQVRRLRRLPRRRRQGQPGARCAEPHRQGLAARLGRAGRSWRWSTAARTTSCRRTARACRPSRSACSRPMSGACRKAARWRDQAREHHPHRPLPMRAATGHLALREAEDDPCPQRQRLVRQLALGPGLGHADSSSTACRGCSGTIARRCCSTSRRAASTSAGWCCIRRTSST